MKQLLVIGGTSFIGRHLLNELLQQESYEITLFNRGLTNPDLFPTVDKIRGDRNDAKAIHQLFSKKWDCIIDVSCYFPQSLEWILNGIDIKSTKYIFVSTCSVYDNEQYSGMNRAELAPTLFCTKEQAMDSAPETYGQRKAACESLLEASGIAYTTFRPALVFGPYDPTDRFYYWLHQVKTKQKIGIPERGNRKFSLTYVGDLVAAIMKALHSEAKNKSYNCISYENMSIREIVNAAMFSLKRTPELVNYSKDFLKRHQITPWTGIPVWLSTDDYTYSSKSICEDLAFKPTSFSKSIEATIAYYEEICFPKPSFGMDEEKQQVLFLAYKKEMTNHP